MRLIPPYVASKTPPKKYHELVFSSIELKRLLVPKKAMAKKTMSDITTPISRKIADLVPLLMLVSKTVKKTGPIVKERTIPIGIAGINSIMVFLNINLKFFY